MTGIPVGELNEDGTYPKGTINYLVMKRLTELSESMEKKTEKDEEKEEKKENKEEQGRTKE